MNTCHHAQVPRHLPYCTMALKERCKQEPCQAEKSLLLARIFRALRCFAAVQRAQNGTACQPRHAPKKCSHASSRRRRAARKFGTKLDSITNKTLAMTQNTSSEGVLTLAEVAAYLKVTERTIYRLAGAKKIPAFKVGGVWRFRKMDIDAWIHAQSVDSAGGER